MARRASKSDAEFIEQCKQWSTHWEAVDPAGFGLSEAQVDAFTQACQAAIQAEREAGRAADLARAAFLKKRTALKVLRTRFGAAATTIDATARLEGPDVYALARIDPPGDGGPRPVPAAPGDFTRSVRTDGSIEVAFEINDRGRGALTYEVQRQLNRGVGLDGPWRPLMTIGAKRFIDEDVPRGLASVSYRVRAIRSNGRVGQWGFGPVVYFGTVASQPGPVRRPRPEEGVARAG
ncbi:MAG: hypothetical protein RIE32_14315 [Phycisphaerales bacterium]